MILPDPEKWMIEEVHRRTGLPLPDCRTVLDSASLADYHAIFRPDRYHREDPAEADPTMATVLLRAALEAEREAGPNTPGSWGWCHVFWGLKQAILRDKYGVEWRTPVEMNPGTISD